MPTLKISPFGRNAGNPKQYGNPNSAANGKTTTLGWSLSGMSRQIIKGKINEV
jgi:hypothetical protein